MARSKQTRTADADHVDHSRAASASAQALPDCLLHKPTNARETEPMAVRGGRAGVLILHGLTGSPWEVRPLAEACAAAGYSVAMPLLPGHGTQVLDLDRTRWTDWLAAAREALDWLAAGCDRVHVVGMSMGALLALEMERGATPVPLRSLLLLAPAMGLPLPTALAVRVLARVGLPRTVGKKPTALPGVTQSPGYRAMPLAAVDSLLDLMERVRARRHPLQLPVLVLHGTDDRTIPFAIGKAGIAPLMGSLGIFVPIAGAGHLLLRTEQGPEVLRRCLKALTTLEPYGPLVPGAVPLREAVAAAATAATR